MASPKIKTWQGGKLINTIGQLLQAVFIAIVVLVVAPFQCYTHLNGTQSASAFPAVLCWETDEHTGLLITAAVMLVCFVVPFCSTVFWANHVAPFSKKPDVHYTRFRSLIYRFRPDRLLVVGQHFPDASIDVGHGICDPSSFPLLADHIHRYGQFALHVRHVGHAALEEFTDKLVRRIGHHVH